MASVRADSCKKSKDRNEYPLEIVSLTSVLVTSISIKNPFILCKIWNISSCATIIIRSFLYRETKKRVLEQSDPLIHRVSVKRCAFSSWQYPFIGNGMLEPCCVMLPPSSNVRRISLSQHRPPLGAVTRAKREKGTAGVALEPPTPLLLFFFSLHGGRLAIKILMVRFRPRTGQSTNYSTTTRPWPDIRMSTCFP